jgi:hypothetical protein
MEGAQVDPLGDQMRMHAHLLPALELQFRHHRAALREPHRAAGLLHPDARAPAPVLIAWATRRRTTAAKRGLGQVPTTTKRTAA